MDIFNTIKRREAIAMFYYPMTSKMFSALMTAVIAAVRAAAKFNPEHAAVAVYTADVDTMNDANDVMAHLIDILGWDESLAFDGVIYNAVNRRRGVHHVNACKYKSKRNPMRLHYSFQFDYVDTDNRIKRYIQTCEDRIDALKTARAWLKQADFYKIQSAWIEVDKRVHSYTLSLL